MRFLKIILFISYLVILNSCVIWHTQTPDIPLINTKKDLRVDASISFIPSAQATVSYGLTDKVAVQLYGNIGIHDRYYIQPSIGLYKKLKKRKVQEIYAGFGYGYGYVNLKFDEYSYGNYQLYFVQYNFGIISNEQSILETGIGLKTGILDYSHTRGSNYINEEYSNSYRHYYGLIEPIVFLRLGRKRLRFMVKIGGTAFYHLERNYYGFMCNFSLGLNYRI